MNILNEVFERITRMPMLQRMDRERGMAAKSRTATRVSHLYLWRIKPEGWVSVCLGIGFWISHVSPVELHDSISGWKNTHWPVATLPMTYTAGTVQMTSRTRLRCRIRTRGRARGERRE